EPIREGLRLLLEEWGFDAYTAASLAQARSITDECDGQIDLILCDLHLSQGEDGLQAIQLVRKLAGRAVPAIVITGDTSPAEIRRASGSGNPVLFKPVQPRQLMAALHAITPE
ncbi:MAG: response regulator, partial [Leptothrix sp. (in: b-proteobacteria)]